MPSLREQIADLPQDPGVYIFRDEAGTVIYVGKAKNLRARVRNYLGADDRFNIPFLMNEAITVEHLASIGRRTAIERTAHFFLELGSRLSLVGLADVSEFVCPLTQYDLADALGLSAIHVNRVLRELREVKLLTFQDHKVTIHDRAGLKELAGYEDIEETALLVRDEMK